jgi:MFS family permease
LTLAWGVVSTLQGVTQSLTGFLIVRFFLGVAESGLFPGVVYYFSMWYKRSERQYRIALFFSAASLAGAFGGILAYVGSLYRLMVRDMLILTRESVKWKAWVAIEDGDGSLLS